MAEPIEVELPPNSPLPGDPIPRTAANQLRFGGVQGSQASERSLEAGPLGPDATPREYMPIQRRQFEEESARERADFDRYRREQDRRIADIDRFDRAHPVPPPPHLLDPVKDLAPPPDQRQYQKYAMAYLGASTLVAAVFGKVGRIQASAGLAAMAGAANGWQAGNQQAYENGVQQWNQSNKALIQHNDMTLKSYDLILNNRSLQRGEMIEKLKIAALQHNDSMMYDQMVKGNLEAGFKLRDLQHKANTDLKGSIAPYQKGFAEANAKAIERSNKYAEMEANGWVDPRTGQPYINENTMQPYTDEEKVRAKHETDRIPPGSTIDDDGNIKFPGAGGRKLSEYEMWVQQNPGKSIEDYWKAKRLPPRNAPAIYIQKYMDEHPEAKSADIRKQMAIYNATQARMRTLGTREANALVAINEMQKTAVLAQKASDAVPRGKFTPINQIKQDILRGTSSPEMKAFDDANSAFITAYAQTMSRSGATTVHSQQRAEAVLNTKDGPEAYRAGIKQLMAEANAVKEAVADAFEELSGGGTEARPPTGGAGAAGGAGEGDPKGMSDQQILEGLGLGAK